MAYGVRSRGERAPSLRPSPPLRGGEGEERHASRPLRSPCDGCDARCCRTYAVHVTGEDAFRIARGTGRDMIEFLTCLREPGRSDTGFLLERGGPTYSLILETARTDEPKRPCIFFRANPVTGEGRCGIYPLRPAACRRFPAVSLDGERRGVGVREGIVCPEGAWDGYPIERLSWRVALARASRAAELYAVVVAEWNARLEDPASHGDPRPFDRYLDYLADVYAWIVQCAARSPRATRRDRVSSCASATLSVNFPGREDPGERRLASQSDRC